MMKHLLNLIWFFLLANQSFADTKAAIGNDIAFNPMSPTFAIRVIDMKNAVRVATLANITLFGTQTIDDVPLMEGDRILVKNQTSQNENGIYIIKSEAWIRAEDFDDAIEIANSAVAVIAGTVNIYSKWACKATHIVLGTGNITFVKVTGADPSDPSAE